MFIRKMFSWLQLDLLLYFPGVPGSASENAVYSPILTSVCMTNV